MLHDHGPDRHRARPVLAGIPYRSPQKRVST
jgi:hypothetical protein